MYVEVAIYDENLDPLTNRFFELVDGITYKLHDKGKLSNPTKQKGKGRIQLSAKLFIDKDGDGCLELQVATGRVKLDPEKDLTIMREYLDWKTHLGFWRRYIDKFNKEFSEHYISREDDEDDVIFVGWQLADNFEKVPDSTLDVYVRDEYIKQKEGEN